MTFPPKSHISVMLGVLMGDSAPQTRVSRRDHTFLPFPLSNCGFWYHDAHAVQVWCQKTEVEISKMALKSAKNGKNQCFAFVIDTGTLYTPPILIHQVSSCLAYHDASFARKKREIKMQQDGIWPG